MARSRWRWPCSCRVRAHGGDVPEACRPRGSWRSPPARSPPRGEGAGLDTVACSPEVLSVRSLCTRSARRPRPPSASTFTPRPCVLVDSPAAPRPVRGGTARRVRGVFQSRIVASLDLPVHDSYLYARSACIIEIDKLLYSTLLRRATGLCRLYMCRPVGSDLGGIISASTHMIRLLYISILRMPLLCQ